MRSFQVHCHECQFFTFRLLLDEEDDDDMSTCPLCSSGFVEIVENEAPVVFLPEEVEDAILNALFEESGESAAPRRPTDRSVLDALEKRCEPIEESHTCSICLEPSCGVKLPACGHCFHKPCIFAWLEDNDTCPVCRQKQE